MPAGDPQRTWFPEMLDVLRTRWRNDLSFEQMVELAGELDSMLHRIRSVRQIRTPIIRCRRCGRVGPAAEPDVTVRAMILSLGRFGIASAEQVKELEKRWAAHRSLKGLDVHGKLAAPAIASTRPCAHSDLR